MPWCYAVADNCAALDVKKTFKQCLVQKHLNDCSPFCQVSSVLENAAVQVVMFFLSFIHLEPEV